ncbi:hypothetical protein VE00_06952 [Pseudogymnoascus sp. WSF 3629]|nr:hypothetical protein VE00_06952 [Pseudogymnoascus sp. WSF 3629]
MNGTSGAEAGQLAENQSGMNADCADCVKLAEKLEKCKGSEGRMQAPADEDQKERLTSVPQGALIFNR